MLFTDKRLNIIVGAYGSGKSEVSVNCARIIKEEKKEGKVLIADLDIVNPFYRSADAAKRLEDDGIRVICPSYANSNVDAPVLTGEMYVIFDDPEYSGVFDIGGEDMGANVLGSLKTRLEGIDCNLLMVVNTLRPFTSDVQGIAQMASELQEASRMKISGYINNTNLLEETTFEEVEEGEKIVAEAARLTGIPLLATTVMEGVATEDQLKTFVAPEIITMRRTIRYNY
ncbi:hypothetical protein SAMN06296952_1567 [Oscillospiraceae bacterium]|nr:hypothetical protein SAMN06296952_1567 [Oscillospiraceae bacterium]